MVQGFVFQGFSLGHMPKPRKNSLHGFSVQILPGDLEIFLRPQADKSLDDPVGLGKLTTLNS